MPSIGPEIRTRRAIWTVLLAPSPRKIHSGSESIPSRSEMNRETASRMTCDSLGLGVGAEAVHGAFQDDARSLDDVGREDRVLPARGGGVEEGGKLAEGKGLANVGEGLLTEGLGVADVPVQDPPARFLELGRARDDGAAHGVLRSEYGQAEVGKSDGHTGLLTNMTARLRNAFAFRRNSSQNARIS